MHEAGAVAKKFFRGPLKQWTKGQGDSPVTEADIAVERAVCTSIWSRPGDGWLSEESENDPTRLAARRVWVVDPIDGTRAFIAGREDWSVSVALVMDGRPVAAALFAPVTDELFLATAGGGATRNGIAIQASSGSSLDGARIGGPKRMHGTHRLERHRHCLRCRASIPWRCGLRGSPHAELDAAVAGGNGHDWDLAAADLLVHEAGGMMTALDGQVLIYNRPDPVHSVLIAAGRGRHAALAELIRAQTSEPV